MCKLFVACSVFNLNRDRAFDDMAAASTSKVLQRLSICNFPYVGSVVVSLD